MTQSSTRQVTYTLASRTSGVPGLEKFASSLERIRAVQDQIKRQGDVIAGLRDKTATIRLKFESASITAELARIQNKTVNINVKVGNLQAAQNDINTLKGLLSGLSGRTQYQVTVNVTALTAVHANINTQITQLQSLIAQLRALGNSGGPGGGGRGGAGGPSGSTSQLLSELTALNNQWKRNEIDAAAFGAALVTLQGKLRTAASGAQAGTADFRALDAGLTRLTTSLRSINTDAFQKIRTDASAMRGAFDAATAGVTRNSQQFRTAVSAYETSTNSLIARLQSLASSGTLTTTQLGQVNREMARLAREANTIAGGVNAGGLSGNIFNALRAGFPIIGQMGGALGQAAGQAGMFGSAIGSAAAAFGPLGIAIGVTTVAVGLLTAGIMSAVNEYGRFEAQMQGVKAVSDATGSAFKGLKDQAKDLALEFGLNVNQIGQVQEELFKAGQGVEDVMGGAAKAVTVLMRATGSDLNNAVLIAGAAMNTFNIQGSNMMRVADAIANGANKTALDVNTLGVAMQQVGNSASGAGLELEETVAMLGLMADRGIRGSDAGTSLKMMLQRLTADMPQVTSELDKYNIKVYDGTGAQRDMITVLGEVISVMDKMTDQERGAFLYKVAGADAQRVLTASYKAGTTSISDYIAMMGDRGRAERDAKTRMEGLQGAQAKLNTTFQIFKDTVGEVFAPAVTTLVNAAATGVSALTDLFKWLDDLNARADEVEKTALGKELEALQKQLTGERSQLRNIQQAADAQKARTGGVSEQTQTRLDTQIERVAGLEAQVKVLELQVRTEAVKNGTFVGPVQPGQDDGGREGLALTAAGADALGAMVVKASSGKLGDVSADSIVNFCAKWVRLTLDKAAPEAEAKINALFQTDSNGDGKTEATDAARNLLKAGFAQRYSGTKDLKPGDVVFYTEGGQNHTGIYIGDGMVRGNNRVTYAANGGKFDSFGNPISPGINPVGNVAINKLGTPNWFVRPGDMLPALGVNPPKPKNAKGADPEDGPITAAQIAQAQKLVAALEKATKLKAENPKDIAITKGFDKAAQDLEKFSKASDENARAVKAVQSGWEGSKKGANDYIATQADLKKYGNAALELIKRQEQANMSGNAEQIRAADEALKAWQGTSKARIAVTQVESAAYQSRKQLAAQSLQDEEKNAALMVQIAEEAAAGREKQARAALDTLKRSQADRLDLAQDDAAKRQAIITQTGPQILAAEALINQRVREQAVKAAQVTADKRKEQAGADTKAIEQARRNAVAEAYRVEKQANETARSEQSKAERGAARTVAQEQKQLAQELAGLKIDAAKSTSSRLKSIGEEDIRAHEGDLKKQLALTKLYSQQEFDRQQAIAIATRKLAYDDAKGKPNEQALREKAQAEYLATVETARIARLGTMRTATEAAAKGQEEFNQALADGVKAGNEALDTLDKVNLGGRDLATTAQTLPSTRAQFDTLYARIVILRDELAEPGVADAWTQSIEDMGKAGQLSAVQVQTLLDILKDLNGSRDGQLGDNLQGRGVTNTTRFDDASQGTLASGEAERLLEAMIGMDPEELGGILADLVAKGFGESDLGRLIRGHIQSSAAAIDESLREFGGVSRGVNEVRPGGLIVDGEDIYQTEEEIRNLGVTTDATTETFFNMAEAIQNAGKMSRDELEDLIRVSELGVDAALELWAAWGQAHPVDFGAQLNGIMQAQALLDGLEGATDPAQIQAITGDIGTFLASDVGKLLPDSVRDGLTAGVEEAKEYAGILAGITTDAVSNGLKDAVTRTGGASLPENRFGEFTSQILGGEFDLSNPEVVKGLYEGLDLSVKNGELTVQQLELIKLLVDSINNTPVDVLPVNSGWQQLEEWNTKLGEMEEHLKSGAVSQKDFNAEAFQTIDTLEGLADAALAAGDIDLATNYITAAKGLRALVPAADQATEALRKQREELEKQQKALTDFFAKFSQTTEALGAIARSIGGLFGEAGSQFGDAMGEFFSSGMKGAEGIARVMANPADIQGWAQAIQGVLGYYQALGKMFDSLNPKLKAWQKSLLEVADTEKKALTLNSGGFKSPWAEQLEQDAANREKRGNAGFWKRLWWDLTGSAPEVMKTESAKLLAELQTIFAGLGEGLAGALSNSMTDAFLKGDMADFAANFEKTFDQTVGKVVLQTMIEAAIQEGAVAQDLGELTQAIKDRRYNDIPSILARIKQHAGEAMAPIAALAPSLPGYGSGGGGTSGGDPTISPVDKRRRDELLYQYEHATDPAEKERLRKELLGLSGSTGGGGTTTTISAAPVKTETPDWAALNAGINRLADFGAQSDQIARMEADTARMNRESAGVMAQAAGMMLLAAQGRGSSAGPGNINF